MDQRRPSPFTKRVKRMMGKAVKISEGGPRPRTPNPSSSLRPLLFLFTLDAKLGEGKGIQAFHRD